MLSSPLVKAEPAFVPTTVLLSAPSITLLLEFFPINVLLALSKSTTPPSIRSVPNEPVDVDEPLTLPVCRLAVEPELKYTSVTAVLPIVTELSAIPIVPFPITV